jgi:hypothetical protein
MSATRRFMKIEVKLSPGYWSTTEIPGLSGWAARRDS